MHKINNMHNKSYLVYVFLLKVWRKILTKISFPSLFSEAGGRCHRNRLITGKVLQKSFHIFTHIFSPQENKMQTKIGKVMCSADSSLIGKFPFAKNKKIKLKVCNFYLSIVSPFYICILKPATQSNNKVQFLTPKKEVKNIELFHSSCPLSWL